MSLIQFIVEEEVVEYCCPVLGCGFKTKVHKELIQPTKCPNCAHFLRISNVRT